MGKKIKLMTVLLCLLLLDPISHSSSIPQEHIHTNPIQFVNTSFFLLLSPSVETQTVFFSSAEKNGPFPKRPPECVNLKTPACCFSVYRGKLSFLQNSDVRLLSVKVRVRVAVIVQFECQYGQNTEWKRLH